MTTDILITLGSNLEPCAEAEKRLRAALQVLSRKLTDLQVSTLYATPAEGHAVGTYVNCVAAARTTLDEAALEADFKQLEVQFGRTPADKLAGRVPLDVDLVQYGTHRLRPKNWLMQFMRRGLTELNIAYDENIQ
jgi:2-amino-4-hydroxy-6-hydroxymethyldihydropteridine diphosphokinase